MFHIVKSSPAQGFDGVFRAGTKWPKDGARVLFTKKKRGDKAVPEIKLAEDDDKKPYLAVDAESEKALREDPRISIQVEGEGEEEIISLRKRVAELEAKLQERDADLAKATKRVAELEKAAKADQKPAS